MTEYCQKLKTLADGLADVGNPVSDETLVLQTILGLNDNFATHAAVIPLQTPFPTFLQCRSMLHLEESRLADKTPMALTTTTTSASTTNSPQTQTQAPPPNPPAPTQN